MTSIWWMFLTYMYPIIYHQQWNSNDDELRYILNQDLDNEFMEGIISDDDGSDSTNDDNVQKPDNSLSVTEVDGNENSTPIRWMSYYSISR